MDGESVIIDAIRGARHAAVHLEMRDTYTPDDPDFIDWRAGVNLDVEARSGWWTDLVKAAVARGVRIRRARIVSEPVTEYIHFEYDVTAGHNVAAGEEVRWLPHRRASDLALPGNDFWLFDGERVVFNHFAGDGRWPDDGTEVSDDPAVVMLCAAALRRSGSARSRTRSTGQPDPAHSSGGPPVVQCAAVAAGAGSAAARDPGRVRAQRA